MIDKLVGAIKKVFGTDKDGVVDGSIQNIDKVVKEVGIDRRGFFQQKAMYRDTLNMVLDRQGESAARELGVWIIDYIKKHGDTPVRQKVREQAELL